MDRLSVEGGSWGRRQGIPQHVCQICRVVIVSLCGIIIYLVVILQYKGCSNGKLRAVVSVKTYDNAKHNSNDKAS